MNSFKKKQLKRVIDSIGRANSIDSNYIKEMTDKYCSYDNYEEAINDLIYEIYTKYKKKKELCSYSLGMIRSISSFYKDDKQMLEYAKSRKRKVKQISI